jgi:hypothetical protein
MMMSQIEKINYSDFLGAAASGLCAIHCALTPLFFAAKPAIASVVDAHGHSHGHGHEHGHGLWAGLDFVFLALSLLAVIISTRHTDHKPLKRVIWIAWAVFAYGLLAEHFALPLGHWAMYAGSITLVVAHLKHYQYCQRCKMEASNPQNS